MGAITVIESSRRRDGRHVLVVGAGLAGARCAEALRAGGYEGRVTLVGEEPRPPYERPALSKDLLVGTKAPESLALRPDGHWREHGIDVLPGRESPESTHARVPRSRTAGDAGVARLVLATGGGRGRCHDLPAGCTFCARSPMRSRSVGSSAPDGGLPSSAPASSAARSRPRHLRWERMSPSSRRPTVPLERVLGPEAGLLIADRYRDQGVELRLGAGSPVSVAARTPCPRRPARGRPRARV